MGGRSPPRAPPPLPTQVDGPPRCKRHPPRHGVGEEVLPAGTLRASKRNNHLPPGGVHPHPPLRGGGPRLEERHRLQSPVRRRRPAAAPRPAARGYARHFGHQRRPRAGQGQRRCRIKADGVGAGWGHRGWRRKAVARIGVWPPTTRVTIPVKAAVAVAGVLVVGAPAGVLTAVGGEGGAIVDAGVPLRRGANLCRGRGGGQCPSRRGPPAGIPRGAVRCSYARRCRRHAPSGLSACGCRRGRRAPAPPVLPAERGWGGTAHPPRQAGAVVAGAAVAAAVAAAAVASAAITVTVAATPAAVAAAAAAVAADLGKRRGLPHGHPLAARRGGWPHPRPPPPWWRSRVGSKRRSGGHHRGRQVKRRRRGRRRGRRAGGHGYPRRRARPRH